MFYNGGTCCPNQTSCYYPVGNYQNRNNYAIVLVLFILLVIIIGNRFSN
jgi:uncharacterized membrane protein